MRLSSCSPKPISSDRHTAVSTQLRISIAPRSTARCVLPRAVPDTVRTRGLLRTSVAHHVSVPFATCGLFTVRHSFQCFVLSRFSFKTMIHQEKYPFPGGSRARLLRTHAPTHKGLRVQTNPRRSATSIPSREGHARVFCAHMHLPTRPSCADATPAFRVARE